MMYVARPMMKAVIIKGILVAWSVTLGMAHRACWGDGGVEVSGWLSFEEREKSERGKIQGSLTAQNANGR